MTEKNAGGMFRKLVTRALAAGALLVVYSISTVAVSTIAAMTTGVSTAQAQRGRGGRGVGRGRGVARGRGRGRGRGFLRGGIWVPQVWCHQSWNSRRVYCGW